MKVTPWLILAVLGWTAVFTTNSLAQATNPKPPAKPAPAQKPPVSAQVGLPGSVPTKMDDSRISAPGLSDVLENRAAMARAFATIGRFSLPADPKEYRCKIDWSLTSAGVTAPITLDMLINTVAPTRSREFAEANGNKTMTHDFSVEVKGISGNELLISIDGSFLTNDGNYERTNEFFVTTVATLGVPRTFRSISKGTKGATRDTAASVIISEVQ